MTKEELEKENAELRNNGFTVSAMTEQQLKVALEKGEQLEKENAELKHQLAHRNCIDCSNHSSNLRMRNLELEKENAELKADFIKSCKVKEQGFREAEQALEHKDDQLTKAKEILKAVVDFYPTMTATILLEAEQFLNSEVEK